MTNIWKRSLSMFMAIVMVISMLPMNVFAEGTDDTPTEPTSTETGDIAPQNDEGGDTPCAHTPGDAATCTTDQTCTVCGEVLAAALGHTPSAEATCDATQTCTVCGDELKAALGHNFGEDNNAEKCSVCEAVNPNYNAPADETPSEPDADPAANAEGGSENGDEPVTDTAPAAPTKDTLNVSLVRFDCETQMHSIWVGNEEVNVGTVAKNGETYICLITVDLSGMVEAVKAAFDDDHAGYTHTLATENVPDTLLLTATWDGVSGKWTVDTYEIVYTCTKTAEEPKCTHSAHNQNGICSAEGCGESVDHTYVEGTCSCGKTEAIDTAEELQAALTAGGEVVLGGNISGDGDNPIALTVPAGVTVVLDLNGYSLGLDALYTTMLTNDGTLTIGDSSAAKTGKVWCKGNAVAIQNNGALTINSGTYEGLNSSPVVNAENSSASVTIKGGTFNATGRECINYKSAAGANNVVINGGVFQDGVYVQAINDGTFNIGDGAVNVTEEITGGTFYNTVNAPAKSITGGTFAKDVSTMVADGYECKLDGEMYVVSVEKVEWYDPEATEYDIDDVADLQAFAAAVNSGVTFEGKTVKLTADIDLSSVANWTPIGNGTNYFWGTFDGQGHTISNMTINVNTPDANQFVGLFGGVRKATIKNLKVTDAKIDVVGKQVRAAAVVAIAHSNSENHTTANLNLENITVDGCVINAEAKSSSVAVGGLSGYCYPANMTNISVSNLTVNPKASGTTFAGGLVGYMQGQNISNNGGTRAYYTVDTFNLNNITINSESQDTLAGGFAGYTYYGYITLKNGKINGFKVNVDVAKEALIGGLIGLAHRSDKGNTFTNVAITGLDFDITSDSGVDVLAGGMVGYSGSPIAYSNCSVSGEITETSRNATSSAITGGFVGGTVSWAQSFTDCTADVDIKASNIAGGFVGSNGVTATYTDCEAKGTVEAKTAGGFAASTNNATYTNCSYNGESAVPFIPGYVAQVGTTYYKTFAEAITAANAVDGGATVTLLADVTVAEVIEVIGNVTIDGANNSITWADGYAGTLFNVAEGASLITKNVTIDGENAFTFYNDTTTVENGQNWYTRFVNVGEEDKAVNADVIVNAGNLTLDEGTKIQNVTIASTGTNGKTENTETGYVLKYNDDLAIIKSNGGTVTMNSATISGNAGMVLNAIGATSDINATISGNMGAGNKGGIIIINGGTAKIAGSITGNKAMARSATVLGVINGAEVTSTATINNNKHIGVGSNTAGAIVVLEGASQFVMNGGSISDNVGGRAGAIASRWSDAAADIELNAGTITGNTASNDSWNGASIFLRSPATIGEGMKVEGTIAVNAAPAELDITGGEFTNFNLIVTDGLSAEISGGTFDADPSEWLAEGAVAPKNEQGLYQVDKVIAEIVFSGPAGGETSITYPGDADSLQALVDHYMFCNHANETAIPGFSFGDYTPVLNVVGDLDAADIAYLGSASAEYTSKEPMTWTVNLTKADDAANIKAADGYVLLKNDDGSLSVTKVLASITFEFLGATEYYTYPGYADGGEPINSMHDLVDVYLTHIMDRFGMYPEDPTIQLHSNIALDETFVIDAQMPLGGEYDYDLTFDLNGYTITSTATPAIRIVDNLDVTVKNGTMDTDSYCFILGASDASSAGNLTIESGSYTGVTTVASVTKGTLTINGGSFATDGTEHGATYLLNCVDAYAKDGSAKVVVKGGTFKGFNPADNEAENPKINFCADGYVSEEIEDGVFGIREANYVAQVGETKYESLQDAVDAANGQPVTIKLIDDVLFNDVNDIEARVAASNGNGKYCGFNYGNGAFVNVIGGNVTIDLNGHSITYDLHDEAWCNKRVVSIFYVTDKANLTVTDSVGTGAVTVYGMGTAAYSVAVDAKVTIKGGTWTWNPCKTCGATNSFLYASHGGEMYITGGKFVNNVNGESGEYMIFAHYSSKETTENSAGVDYDSTKIEISGGTFDGYNPGKIKYMDQGNSNTEKMDNGCAPNYVPTENADGTYSVEALIAEIVFSAFGGSETSITYPGYADSLQELVDYYMLCNHANENAIPGLSAGDYTPVLNVVGNLDATDTAYLGGASTDGTYVSAKPMTWTVKLANADDAANIKAADGYLAEVDNGVLTVRKPNYVAQIGETKYESLQAAIDAAAANDTITLIADVTENVTVDKSLTLDLNGKTITGMLVNNGTLTVNATNGGKIDGGDEAAIDNYGTLTVNGGSFNGAKCAIYNNELEEGQAVITIKGGEFTAPGDYFATIENRYGILTVDGGKITATNSAGYAIVDTYGKTTINGGEIVSASGTAVETYNGEIVINDGAFTGKVIVENQAGNVSVYGGTLVSNTPEYYYGLTNANGGVTVLYGGTFERDYSVAEGSSVQIAPGYEALANNDGTFSVAEWDYQINNKADLLMFASIGKSGDNMSGKTVSLNADIDFEWAEWTAFSFAGTFEGNNNTIKNLTYVPATSGRMGFFQSIGGPAKDLTLDGIKGTVPANGRFGGFARYLNAAVENIHVKNIEVTTTDTLAWVGGFTTYTAGGSTNNCSVENLTVNAQAGADLIAGFISLTSNRQLYQNSTVDGFKVTVNDTHSSGCGVGGFAGQTQTGWNNPKFENCTVTGIDVTATGLVDVGGFIAWPGAHTEYANNCHTQGKIDVTGVTSENCFAGGFFGNLGWNADLGMMGHVLNNCTADVDIITKTAAAGGFVGSATNSNNNSMYATFNDCSASGDITAVEGGTADIGGFAGDADRGVYNNCSATGTVTNNGTGNAGGFIGEILDTIPKYDHRYPAGTREYLVDVTTFDKCEGSAEPFIGKVADTKPAAELVNKASYAASVGEVFYADFDNALAAAKAGDVKTITLLAPVEITENTTLDLTGLTVDGNGVYPAFRIQNGANVTVKGGTVTNKDYIFVLGASDGSSAGNLTIESGSYEGNTSVASVTKGTLTITGGEFSVNSESSTYLLNCIDANYKDGSAKIVVTGGTFTGFNPADNAAENPKANFVAEGYTAEELTTGVWTVRMLDYVAEVNGVKYESVQAAIDNATAGDTIKLIADVTENVTVSKSVTIDGAGKKYTGNISVSGSTSAVTVKNVNFVNGTGYAITTSRINSITIENCAVTNQSLLYAKLSTPTIVVKDTTVTGGNYGAHIVHGSKATFENVTMTGVLYGIMTQNYGAKTITIKNSSISGTNPISVWAKGTATDTFEFEGVNTVSALSDIQNAKYELAATDATLTAPEGLDVTTSVSADHKVVYEDGTYKVVEKVYVAQIGTDGEKFESLQAAINAAKDGDTIVVLENIDLAKTELQKMDGYDTYFLVEGKSVTVDLNGKTISGAYTGSLLVGVFSTDKNGHLTLTGNGTVDVTATGTVYTLITAFNDGSSIIIENGTYKLDKASNSLVYYGGYTDAAVTVKGGTFTLGNLDDANAPWIFNVLGAGDHHVLVTGGTFNADINRQKWSNEAVVAETHYVVNNGNGTWTIMEGAVAHVATGMLTGPYFYRKNVGYATIEEAFAAAVAYDEVNITLLQNVALTKDVEISIDGVVLNANGFALDCNGHEIKLTAAEATLTAAEGLNVTTSVDGYMVVYENGTYKLELGAAKNVNTGVVYSTVNEALDEAQPDDTVQLLKNTNGMMTYVPDQVTLDLNGHTYAVTYMVVFNGGHIVDNSADNTGRLAVDSNKLMINEKNAQLPVKTAEGYMFADAVTFAEKWGSKGYYVSQAYIDPAVHEVLMAGPDEAGITVMIRVSWKNSDGLLRTQDFEYADDQVVAYLASYKAGTGKYGTQFKLELTGLDSIAGFKHQTVVKSDTGVEFCSAGYTP